VPSVAAELRRLTLEPILAPFRAAIEPGFVRSVVEASRGPGSGASVGRDALDQVETRVAEIASAARRLLGADASTSDVAREAREEVAAALWRDGVRLGGQPSARVREAAGYWRILPDNVSTRGLLVVIVCARAVGRAVGEAPGVEDVWLDEWALREVIVGSLQGLGLDRGAAERAAVLVGALARQAPVDPRASARQGFGRLADLLESSAGRRLVGANEYDSVVWFNHEALVELRWWVAQEATIAAGMTDTPAVLGRALVAWRAFAECVDLEIARSGYHLDRLVEGLRARAARADREASDASRKLTGERLDERGADLA
jgi:hypothetical protein